MRNPLVLGVGLALLLATFGDHLTTWMCLREPVPGWSITEANPIAAYLFEVFGLGVGLMIDSLTTILAVTWVYRTSMFPDKIKIGCGLAATAVTIFAVVNNLKAMFAIGIL